MIAYRHMVIGALALLACGGAEQGSSSRTATENPVLAVESDRLWILMQAARINPRCGAYYANASDARLSGLASSCAASERSAVAWLKANGVGDATTEHIREPSFWRWRAEKVAEIKQCTEGAKPGSATFWDQFNACDPYERIVSVEKRNIEDAGLQRPKAD